MKLPRFWQRIIKRIYGPRHPDGRRIVNRVLILAPRGSRKTTTIISGLGLLHTVGHESVQRGQVIIASGSAEQADYGLSECKSIISETEELRKQVRVREDYIEDRYIKSTMRLITSAGLYKSGSTPHAIFLDEYQAFATEAHRSLVKSLKTGLVKRPGTMYVICMNSGRGESGLPWEEYSYARRVALGEIENEAYLPVLFTPDDPHQDPFDEELWHYTNPGLREGWPDINEMRAAAVEAREKPSELDDFKQMNVGFWLENTVSAYVDMAIYDEGIADKVDELDSRFNIAEFRKDAIGPRAGLPAVIGVDLSSSIDLSAVVLAFKDADNIYYVCPFFFCPADNLDERQARTQMPYREWAKDLAHIEATPGNTIDFGRMEAKIRELFRDYSVGEIAIDPALAPNLLSNLIADGLPAVKHPQTAPVMMSPLAETERAVIARKIRHNGHPVLRFCFANAMAERNKLDQITRLRKSKKWLSIDGAQATAMSIGRLFHSPVLPPERSIFEDRDAIARIFGIKLEETGA